MNHLTPQASDSFSRFFANGFDDRTYQLAPLGFLALFGIAGANGSQTLYGENVGVVEIDILRANGQRLAATVHRGPASVITDKEGHSKTGEKFSTFARKWPLIEDLGHIESGQLLHRLPGENPFSGMSRIDRNRALAKKLHSDSVMRHLRTMNYLAAQSILTGTQPAIVGTNNEAYIYDFLRNPDLLIEPDNGWDEAKGTPMADIDEACEALESLGYVQPNFIGIGNQAFDALISNASFQSLADNRRFELIQVSTNNPVPPEYARFVSAGWIPRGMLRTVGGRVLWVFNYNHTYSAPTTGTVTRYLPSEQVFITDINARRDRYFGPADRLPVTRDETLWYMELFGIDMEAGMAPVNIQNPGEIVDMSMFHFDGYRSNDRKTVTLRTQSAPIYAPVQTDGIAVITNTIQG